MNKDNINRDNLKNNQVPFFNGYRPKFYFKPLKNNKTKGEKINDN